MIQYKNQPVSNRYA